MTTIRLRLLTGVATILLAAGTASAQTAATCSFDEATATLAVTVDGQTATLTRTGAGQIRLNGVDCTGATATTTDLIVFNGGALNDVVTMSGDYAPGLTPEEVGISEIEILFNLGDGNDNVRINFAGVPQTVTFTAGGIDVKNDGDEDITTAGLEKVRPYTTTGDDVIDATAYLGGGTLYLWAGGGNDTLYGSAQADFLYGQAGNDSMYGGAGNDSLIGGADDDFYYGEGGSDKFMQDAAVDGNDTFEGGEGRDTVDYSKRAAGVTVTIGNGTADDGAPGVEFDNVDATTENASGGDGADVLVGSSADNLLKGFGGDDELYGGDGRDELRGGLGNDIVSGDSGPDTLYGDSGLDSIDGGAGADAIFGGTGVDTITGGAGADTILAEGGNDVIFNNDGFADSVDCGTGAADDPEPDGLDTFTACELI